jgi:hypothetical protein
MRNFKKFLWLAMLLSPALGMDKVNDNQSDSTRDGSDMLSWSSNAQSNKKPIASSIDQVEPKVVSVQEEEKTGPIKALPAEVYSAIKTVMHVFFPLPWTPVDGEDNAKFFSTMGEIASLEGMANNLFKDFFRFFYRAAPNSSDQHAEFLSAMGILDSLDKDSSLFSEMKSLGIAKQELFDLSNSFFKFFLMLLPDEKSQPVKAHSLMTSFMVKHFDSGEPHGVLFWDVQFQLDEYLACRLNDDQSGADEAHLQLVNQLKLMKDSLPKILQNSKSAGGHASSQQEKEQEMLKSALKAYAQELSKCELRKEDIVPLRQAFWRTMTESMSERLERVMQLLSNSPGMSQAKYAQHIENMGQSLMSFSHNALLVGLFPQPVEFLTEFFENLSIADMTTWIRRSTVQVESLKKINNQENLNPASTQGMSVLPGDQEEEKTGPAQALPKEVRGCIERFLKLLFADPESIDAVTRYGEEGSTHDESLLAMDILQLLDKESLLFSQMKSVGIAKQGLLRLTGGLIEFINVLLRGIKDVKAARLGISLMKNYVGSGQPHGVSLQDVQFQLEKHLACKLNDDRGGADEAGLHLINQLKSMKASLPKCLQNSKSAGGHASFQQEKEQEKFKCALEAFLKEIKSLSCEARKSLFGPVWMKILKSKTERLFPNLSRMSGAEYIRSRDSMEKARFLSKRPQTYELLIDFFKDLSINDMTIGIDFFNAQVESLKKIKNQENLKTGPMKALPQEVRRSIEKMTDRLFGGPWLILDVAAPKSSEECDEFVLAMDTIKSAYKNNQTSLPDKVNVMGQANEMHLKHKIAEHWNWNFVEFIELILRGKCPFARFMGISWMQNNLDSREIPASLKDEFQSQLKNYFVCLFNNDQRGADETGLDLVNLLKRTESSLPKILQNSKSAAGHAPSQKEKEQENFERALEALAQEKSKSKLSANALGSLRESVCQKIFCSLMDDVKNSVDPSQDPKSGKFKADLLAKFKEATQSPEQYDLVKDLFESVSLERLTQWIGFCQDEIKSLKKGDDQEKL